MLQIELAITDIFFDPWISGFKMCVSYYRYVYIYIYTLSKIHYKYSIKYYNILAFFVAVTCLNCKMNILKLVLIKYTVLNYI